MDTKTKQQQYPSVKGQERQGAEASGDFATSHDSSGKLVGADMKDVEIMKTNSKQSPSVSVVEVSEGKISKETRESSQKSTSDDGKSSSQSSVTEASEPLHIKKGQAVEKIEMSASEIISVTAVQATVDGGKTSAVSGNISHNEREKMSTSTPCLLTSAEATDSNEKPQVIQKATSSPVLPVIKITQIDDNEGEIVTSEDIKPAECSAEKAGVKSTDKLPELSSDASAQASSHAAKVVGDTPPNSKNSSIESSEEGIATALESAISPGEGNAKRAVTVSDTTISPKKGGEKQTVAFSIGVSSPEESKENQSSNVSAEGNDQEIPKTVENEAPTDNPPDEEKRSSYISSSEVRPRTRLDSSETNYVSSQETEEPTCLGSKNLHFRIVLFCVFVAIVGLIIYKIARDVKLTQAYETVALSISSVAAVIGVFSILYISILICYPNDVPSLGYQLVGDVETVQSLERVHRRERRPFVPRFLLRSDAKNRVRREEACCRPREDEQDQPSTSADQSSTSGDQPSTSVDKSDKLKSEDHFTKMDELADSKSRLPGADSTEELLTKDAENSFRQESAVAEISVPPTAEQSDSSDSKNTSPSKKDD